MGPRPIPLSRPAAIAVLREAAATGSRVEFTAHALERMRMRRIVRTQVLRCLARGRITEGPAADMHGNWTCRLEGLAEGRGIGVAVAIEPADKVGSRRSDQVIVITAFWMD